jgi:hypothetical protein
VNFDNGSSLIREKRLDRGGIVYANGCFMAAKIHRQGYTFSFTADKSEPNIMKGRFISGQASQLRIEMTKVE